MKPYIERFEIDLSDMDKQYIRYKTEVLLVYIKRIVEKRLEDLNINGEFYFGMVSYDSSRSYYEIMFESKDAAVTYKIKYSESSPR